MNEQLVVIPVDQLKQILKECSGVPEEILTREKVCEILDISLATLKKWTKAGKLTAHGMGDRVYYLRSEVIKSLKPINKTGLKAA